MQLRLFRKSNKKMLGLNKSVINLNDFLEFTYKGGNIVIKYKDYKNKSKSINMLSSDTNVHVLSTLIDTLKK